MSARSALPSLPSYAQTGNGLRQVFPVKEVVGTATPYFI